MIPIIRHESYVIPKNSKKERNIVTTIMSKIVKELQRPMGEYLGRKFSKVRNVTAEQKVENSKKKNTLIEDGRGEGLTLEIQREKKVQVLDGFKFINSEMKEKKANDQKWIVVFNGMGDQYESHLDALNSLSKDVGANVLAFNYRGVGESLGKPASIIDWVEDGQHMLKYLEEKGVKAENITIYGHSLGGGVASNVYKKQDVKSSLIIESSPSSLAKAIGSKRGTLVGGASKIFNWNFNIFKVIKKADQDSQSHIALIVNRRDPTIHYQEVSLYKKLVEKGDGKIKRIKIGEKLESFAKVSVKKGYKALGKAKFPKDKKKITDGDYQKDYEELKKEGKIKHLPHPHGRVMDRRSSKSPQVEGAEKLKPFEDKFRKEDAVAYDEIVAVFKKFLKIS